MVVPPNIQTPRCKPTKPDTDLCPSYPTPLTTPCHFTIPTFLHVLKDLTLHPERNSSLILRADPLPLDTQSQVIKVPSISTNGISRDESGHGTEKEDELDNWLAQKGLEKVEEVRVRLMPKQPQRDTKLDQRVLFYRTPEKVEHEHDPKILGSDGGSSGDGQKDGTRRENKERAVVVMIPLVKAVEDVPFYHPPVRKVVFHYESVEPDETVVDQMDGLSVSAEAEDKDKDKEADLYPVKGQLSISYLPFDTLLPTSTTAPPESHSQENLVPHLGGMRRTSLPRKRSPLAGPSSGSTTSSYQTNLPKEDPQAIRLRLERTCLALIERVYKHGYGTMVGYKKRVNHDTVVKREPFQDLYLTLKERHRHLDSRAPKAGSSKVEDVKRHVFKGVNTSLPDSLSFLNTDLSEWGSQDVAIAAFLMLLWKDMYPARSLSQPRRNEGTEEWDSWGRPPNGFIDLGCGNGLLVHILIAEGYEGKGYELRARRTWPLYPTSTQKALLESPLDPPSLFPDTIEEWTSGSWASSSTKIIQEDTFLIGNHADELTPWLPLLSLIPSKPVPHLSLPCCLHTWDGPFMHPAFTPPPHPHSPEGNFETGLEAGQSRYKSYLMWLGWVGLQCGWMWETEPLRIPSTRGWGIVARTRWSDTPGDLEQCRGWALNEITKVRERGAFKIRVKEGKDH